jgi:hypothetical protein
MNPKAKLYLSLYKQVLCLKPGDSNSKALRCQNIGNIFLEIAAAYIKEPGDDE